MVGSLTFSFMSEKIRAKNAWNNEVFHLKIKETGCTKVKRFIIVFQVE